MAAKMGCPTDSPKISRVTARIDIDTKKYLINTVKTQYQSSRSSPPRNFETVGRRIIEHGEAAPRAKGYAASPRYGRLEDEST